MKRYLTLALLAFLPLAVEAAAVTPQAAERVARNFWNLHHDKDVATQAVPMQRLDVEWDAFFVFAPVEGKGFVIVAADDCVRPVLAYSFHNGMLREQMSPELAWWLDGWQRQVERLREEGGKATEEVAREWERLTVGDDDPRPLTAMAPLVTTQWDQDAPYNDSCPGRSSGWGGSSRAATGCVATAMAQVMKYWNYPERGTGVHSYNSASPTGYGRGFGQQTVDFGATVYDWEHMPDVLTSVSSDVEKAAVATLMYHCGVACDMMYGTAYQGGSGAYIHNIPLLCFGHTLNGMIQFFGYSSSARGMDRVKYDDSTWTAMVRGEIDARRPVIYAGGDDVSGGHCFVCDGYDDEGLFHFNWGWSGDGDGYFTLDHLAPGVGGTGGGTGTYDFTNLQQILTGIQPHGDSDSLCIIRQFPYVQDFEEAPTCWSATSSTDYSFSWMMDDTAGMDGKYSISATASYYGTSEDHLFSPYIIHAGDYKVTWIVRAKRASRPDVYTFGVDSVMLTDSVSSTEWERREARFTVAEGDTVQLDFGHSGKRNSGGVMIDSIVIERMTPPVTGVREVADLEVTLYPNPTTDIVHIGAGEESLRVEVLDMTGRQLVSTTGITVDLSSLPAGIYLLRCISPRAISVQRVIKR